MDLLANQSHPMFGESAGKQCACCSLYAISFATVVKVPGNWGTNDIDFIINEADQFYKSLNKNTYLMVTDLPNIVPMFESHARITYLENEYGILSFSFIPPPRFLSNANCRWNAIFHEITLCCNNSQKKLCLPF